MRILVDYRPALRMRSGVGEYMHGIIGAYTAAHADDTAVFTSSFADRPEPALAAELRVDVVDRHIPVRLLNYLWHRASWPPVEWLAGDMDVVHAAHPLLIPARRAAQVVTIHDLFFLGHRDATTAEIRRDYAALAETHARRADAIVTPSLHTKRLVIERFGIDAGRIYHCPPGAPAWQRPTPAYQPKGWILFIGTLEPRKNLGVVLEAYTRLLERSRHVPDLLLAGRATAQAREWLARIDREPLRGHVKHVGYVPDEDRERLFRGASALVLPSLDEGFGLPVLEAMSAGIPVLASNRGSLPEVVGSAGTLLNPDDADAWTTALERLVGDPVWAVRQREAGLERARAFTWQTTAERLRQAYVDAIARRRER
jgi:glycosyltransferase involved in cell wall biosynthesis